MAENNNSVSGENYGRILNEGMEHLPCAIVIDISGSMRDCMNELCEGLQIMKDTMQVDEKCRNCVDTTIITFSEHAEVVAPFKSCSEMVLPEVNAGGTTAFWEALELAVNEIQTRKEQYKAAGIAPYNRGWIFIFTDGLPTDDKENKERVIKLLEEKVASKSVSIYPFGIGDNVDKELLAGINGIGREKGMCLTVSRENLKDCFTWLSISPELPELPDTVNVEPVDMDWYRPTPPIIKFVD